MAELQKQCPQCGNMLQISENGRIGRCPHHKLWYRVEPGAEAEASRQNAEDARERQRKIDQAKAEKEAAARAVEKQRKATLLRLALLALTAVVAVAVMIVLFVVKPRMDYDAAQASLDEGNYALAQEQFLALGSYQDAPDKAVLCGAMTSLRGGDTENAIAALDQLIQGGSKESAALLQQSFVPVVNSWQSSGLSPEAVLAVLARRDSIDPEGALEIDRLTHEAHAALLTDVRSSIVANADEDEALELIVLDSGFAVTAYDMTATGNEQVTMTGAARVRSGIAFGDACTDVSDALRCYLGAYAESQDEDTAAKVIGAYQQRAAQLEAAGETAAALEDARQAASLSDGQEDFAFYYDMMLRSCMAMADRAAAVENWDAFAISEGEKISRFYGQQCTLDGGRLRLQLAIDLAAAQDANSVEAFRSAHACGADASKALLDAISQQRYGLLRVQLRHEALRQAPEDGARQEALQAETVSALNNWRSLEIPAQEALQILLFADENGIPLDGCDRGAFFQAAAVAAAGADNASTNRFVSWDGDAYDELLTIDVAGRASLWALRGQWTECSVIDTALPQASLTVFEGETPLVLVASGAQDAFAVLSGSEGALSLALREDGIIRYALAGSTVTFERLLPGSIQRCEQYIYDIQPDSAPVRTGIDWQEDAYPAPADAQAALLRYLEARAYAIAPEAALLTADAPYAALGFDLAVMAQLPTPDAAEAIALSAYDLREDAVLFEAVYPAMGREQRVYFAVTCAEDRYLVSGAALTYSPNAPEQNVDHTVPALALNAEMTGHLADKKDADSYRILLPQAAEVSLLWQSGTENKARTAFTVTLYSADDLTKPVISYDLTLSTSRQLSHPLFLAPGVYYVTVAPNVYTDVPYAMTIQAQPNEYVESESNDALTDADPIQLNQAYTGSLKNGADVDCYQIELTEPGQVYVSLQADAEGKKTARYNVAIGQMNGAALTAFQMTGDVKTARSCNLYLAPGQYVIQVSRGSYASASAYELTAAFTPHASCEQEANNTPETAAVIPVNQDVTGSFGAEGDKDHFTFTLAEDCVIQPHLTFTPLETSTRTYILTISDGLQTLHTIPFGGKEYRKVTIPLALPAGSYTVELRNPNFIPQDYTLHLTAVPAAACEQEPNDALATASALTLGLPMTGVLSHEEDVDLYKLTLPEDTVATLRFSFPASTVSGTAYVLRLEQNGKSVWSQNIKGSSGGLEAQMQIPAGEYYIRLKPSTWVSAVYTLELK